ncbi:MmcQ/YjbR family DNA-binding protein [Streptomyces sp. NRRL B-24484]|uniref:MmcQ/YjbR family DNA-binding protein n=1 Tax=Streptomyces sp. NRRL B-24484 TaxID=1463833 RepID=UPI0004BF8561|nr:MmcQ/YjbR family DNA-binding protein [Streptomyces sp. NRRL B-24484]
MVTFDQFLEMGPALPSATERPTRETEVTLRVGEKIFAMGTPESGRVCVKASEQEQAALLPAAPDTYAVAPYVGRHGRVPVELGGVGADELREPVTEARRSTAPKRPVRTFDAERAT